MTLTLRQPEIISLPFGSNLNLEREALCGSSIENSSFNLYRAKYEPNAFCGFVLNDLFYVMYSECCIPRGVKKKYLINIPTQLTDENSIIVT